MNEMEAKFSAVTRELRDGYVWRQVGGSRKGKAGSKDVAVAHDILAVKSCSMEAQIAELAEAIRRPETMAGFRSRKRHKLCQLLSPSPGWIPPFGMLTS